MANEAQFNSTRWNGNGSVPSFTVLKRVNYGNAPDAIAPISVRTSFNTERPATVTAKAITPSTRTVTGPFSLLRALQTSTLYSVNIWDSEELKQEVFNARQVSTTLYSDFILFNYLPTALTPTETEFNTFVNGTAEEVSNVPENVGLETTTEIETILTEAAPVFRIPTPFTRTLCEVLLD